MKIERTIIKGTLIEAGNYKPSDLARKIMKKAKMTEQEAYKYIEKKYGLNGATITENVPEKGPAKLNREVMKETVKKSRKKK